MVNYIPKNKIRGCVKMTNIQKNNFNKAKKHYNRIKAEHEKIRAIDEQSKIKVLTENQFYSEEDGERITESDIDFLMSESDFISYCKLVYIENTKKGLNVPDYETSVDYETFKALIQAEDSLLTAGFEIIPNSLKDEKMTLESARNHWKFRDEMLKLMLRLAF